MKHKTSTRRDNADCCILFVTGADLLCYTVLVAAGAFNFRVFASGVNAEAARAAAVLYVSNSELNATTENCWIVLRSS